MYKLRAFSMGGHFKKIKATENFEVSLDKMLHTKSVLTKNAKKKEAISDFMKGLEDNQHYTQQDMEDGLQLYISIINKLKEKDIDEIKDEAQAIVSVLSNNTNKEDDDKEISKEELKEQYLSSLNTIQKNIENVYKVLIENQGRTAAPQDEKERRTYYDIFLKGYRLIGEIITKKELSVTELTGNLVLISDLNNYCSQAWKDTLEELMVTYREDVYKILKQDIAITEEKDKIKRRLDTIFFEARDKVFKDLSYGCIKKNGIDISYRPHCMDINRKYLNDAYGFNLGETNLKDAFMYEELHDKLLRMFKRYIKSFDIEELVINQAILQYSEVLNGENAQKAQNEVVDWSYTYMLNNNLNSTMSRNDFLSEYVYDDTLTSVRKIAIEEIMRDKGYINKKWERDINAHLAGRVEKALRHSEKEGELEKVKMELSKRIDKTKNKSNLFEIYKGIIDSDKYNECEELLAKCIEKLPEHNMQILREALKKNKLDLLKLVEKNGVNIYMENKSSGTCLNYACAYYCDIDIMEYLLDRGLNINYQTETGLQYTVLMLACNMGRKEIVDLLIKRGANINVKRGDSNTPLMYAIDGENLDIIKKLVENGADINRVSGRERNSPLLIATKIGNKDIIDYLLKNNADINKANIIGMTPLMQACVNGDSELALYLILNNANFKIRNVKGYTALELACANGNLHVVKALIENGIPQEEGALAVAIKNKRLNVVEYLIDRGAYVNTINKNGLTPLMYAIRNQDIKMAKLLINKGAIIKKTQTDAIKYLLNEGAGLNLLISGIKNKDETLIQYLVKHNVKINGKDESKNTPLIYACANGNLDTVKYLVKNGANIDLEGKGGFTPLIVASVYGHLEIMEYLLEHGAVIDKPNSNNRTVLMHAVKKGYLGAVDFLLKHGANINEQDINGDSILMIACKEGHLGITKYLVDNGANLNDQNLQKETPLMIACRNKCADIVDYFIGKGVDLEIRNNEGQTAMDIAKLTNDQEIIDLFEQKQQRDTYMQEVINKGNLDVVDQLLKDGLKISSIQRIYRNLEKSYIFDYISVMYDENNNLGKSIKETEIIMKTIQSMRLDKLFDMLKNNQKSESYNKIVLENLSNIDEDELAMPIVKTIRKLMENATENLKSMDCKDLLEWVIKTNSLAVVKTIIKCDAISKTYLEDENFSKLISKVRSENVVQELEKYRGFIKTMNKGTTKNDINLHK